MIFNFFQKKYNFIDIFRNFAYNLNKGGANNGRRKNKDTPKAKRLDAR